MPQLTAMQEKMVLDNLKLVHYFAHKYKPLLNASSSYSYEDLISEGNIALIKAAIYFDESKGIKFVTFAGKYIASTMLTFINKNVPLAKVSRIITDNVQKVIKQGLTENSAEKIAETLGISVVKAREAKKYLKNRESLSLNEPIVDDGGTPLTLEDKIASTIDVDFDSNLIVQEMMSLLNDQEKTIVQMRLDGATQQEIAQKMNTSQPIISRAINRMKIKIKQNVLNDQRKGQLRMNKRSELTQKIPRETLKQLLIEDKTSAEIGEQFGVTAKDIDNLKYVYKLTKTALRAEKETVEPSSEIIEQCEIKQEVQQERVSTVKSSVQSQTAVADIEELTEGVKKLLEALTKNDRLVINIQNITINVEMSS